MKTRNRLALAVFTVLFASALPFGCALRGELADRETGHTNKNADAARVLGHPRRARGYGCFNSLIGRTLW